MIVFKCHACGTSLRVSDDKAGGKGKCPKCSAKVTVPLAGSIVKSPVGSGNVVAMDPKRALEVLGLPPKTTLRRAREAYRELAKRHHPDMGTERSATKFIEVVAAYEFLKDYVEASKTQVAVPVRRPVASSPLVHSSVYEVSYGAFVADLDAGVGESVNLFRQEREVFSDRIKSLIDAQISSYTSAREFRKRMQPDVDAVIQRELWAFIERIGRRCEGVEQGFRVWVDRIRGSAYEIGLPHSMTEYLSRPGGLVLTASIFLILTGAAYLAMYMSPQPFFAKGPIPIIAGILTVAIAGMIGLWGGKAIYLRSARKRGVHERAVLMSQVGFDSFEVGGMPASKAWSSGERAHVAGAGMGVLTLWLDAEPLTGAIAIGVAAVLGWATGKSLGTMQKQAKENLLTALWPRLEDFFDGFVDKLIEFNDQRLRRMRSLYLSAFGPDDNPILQRQHIARPKLAEWSGRDGMTVPTERASSLSSVDRGGRETLLNELREIVGGGSEYKIYVAPNIPGDKLGNAIDSYAQGADPKDVLLLYDDTLWGNAKNGLCLTMDSLFWRNMGEGAQRLALSEARTICVRDAKGVFSTPQLEISGKQVGVNEKEAAEMLARVLRAAKSC